MAHPTRIPVLPHPIYPVRVEVQLALDAEVKRLCATNEIDQVWDAHPCSNARANAIHTLSADRLANQFPDQEAQLVIFADDDYCGLTLQVCRARGKLEYPAFRGVSMSARRRLRQVKAL